LDAITVNGPDGPPLTLGAGGWEAVDWAGCEERVRRLRGRIFKAAREGDWPKVRNLQKLMLRSHANTLVSVRQVTQRNAGRKTPGIDGEVALTSQARAGVAARVHASAGAWSPLAVKRVHIPKARDKAKLRPLGIPVVMDRCHQARVRNALEPEWEARFEPRSYGFRPGRSCHDAIESLFITLSGKAAKRGWVLDADLASAFDRISHDHLITALGGFPAREMVRSWLKAGVFEPGKGFAPTREGTPQGGVISPCLLNIALHGLEEAAGVRYHNSGTLAGSAVAGSPVLVRYADDLTVCCHTRQQAEQVKARMAAWLAPRGLAFNEDKTHIVHVSEGFDFLGFSIRRYPNGKVLIKPSKPAVKRLRERLAAEVRALRGADQAAVIKTLNPIIRGWAAYYRTVVASRTFKALDDYTWKLIWKWVTWRHPDKPKIWIATRYFGRFNKTRNDRWVFGHDGGYLLKFSWTPITRHIKVKGTASPDDPALARYWAARRQPARLPLDRHTLRLLTRQAGRCPLCARPLLTPDQQPQSPDQWERWWLAVTRQAINHDDLALDGQPHKPERETRLVHASCRSRKPSTANPNRPAGLA
jgi:RNA-directed DNA polymerase